LFICSCTAKRAKITVINSSPDKQPVNIRVTRPIDGSFSYMDCDTVQVADKAEIVMDLERQCPVFIQQIRKPGIYSYAESRKEYNIVYGEGGIKVIDNTVQEKYNKTQILP